MLRKKAEKIVFNANAEFAPSNGWLDRLKKMCKIQLQNHELGIQKYN
jgi:hypothetical protein